MRLNENLHLEDVLKLFPYSIGTEPLESEQQMLPTMYINKNKYLADRLKKQQYLSHLSNYELHQQILKYARLKRLQDRSQIQILK